MEFAIEWNESTDETCQFWAPHLRRFNWIEVTTVRSTGQIFHCLLTSSEVMTESDLIGLIGGYWTSNQFRNEIIRPAEWFNIELLSFWSERWHIGRLQHFVRWMAPVLNRSSRAFQRPWTMAIDSIQNGNERQVVHFQLCGWCLVAFQLGIELNGGNERPVTSWRQFRTPSAAEDIDNEVQRKGRWGWAANNCLLLFLIVFHFGRLFIAAFTASTTSWKKSQISKMSMMRSGHARRWWAILHCEVRNRRCRCRNQTKNWTSAKFDE